ncbi:hypothetical protein E2C01_075968 [Portunus trituberculatus]|uniref:Uncharacterized protein n=1 Tax=Portunus trituberculatus TaxID=210409 RepID=A0A5B7IH47_PORTR|nr:hypothetical protein [Portunus trituberculatus]
MALLQRRQDEQAEHPSGSGGC